MSPEIMAKYLVVAGVVMVAAGGLLYVASKMGMGRLPGDIHIQRDGWSFSFPVVTCIVVSLVLTVIFNLLRK